VGGKETCLVNMRYIISTTEPIIHEHLTDAIIRHKSNFNEVQQPYLKNIYSDLTHLCSLSNNCLLF